MDTQIVLGDFTFENLEVPASINFGGGQSMSVKKLVGGQRIVNPLGPDDDDISWSGLMTGPQSLDRAMQLDAMRVAGTQVLFSYFDLRYFVLVKSFKASVEKYYQVIYTIELTVVKNFTQSLGILSELGISDAIIGDLATLNSIAGAINNPTINSALATLSNSVGGIQSFKNAPLSTVSTVLSPANSTLQAVQTQISSLASGLF